jgi:hypothetical protein
MLDLTLTLDKAMPVLRYKTRTFKRRNSTQVWCVFTRHVTASFKAKLIAHNMCA